MQVSNFKSRNHIKSGNESQFIILIIKLFIYELSFSGINCNIPTNVRYL